MSKNYLEKAESLGFELYTYENSSNIILKNKYGLYKTNKYRLEKGFIPTIATAINKTEVFINKANEIHNFSFDYTNTVYIKNNINIEFKCSNNHYVIQTPDVHLRSKGCPVCYGNQLSNTKAFIEKSNLIHNGKYDYSLVDYVNRRTKVKIICKDHGLFEQTADTHLNNKSGCPVCALSETGWTINHFKRKCEKNDGIGFLYIIRCWNESEEFYKIGITSNSVEKRYKSKYHMPYNYEIIQNIPEQSEIVWKIEKLLFKMYSDFKYTPLITFGGSYSECFKL